MKKIKLSGKHAVGIYEYALVDEQDFDMLNAWKWKATPVTTGGAKYAVRNYKQDGKHKTAYMHRVVVGNPQGMDVDHRNHYTVDNQRDNLMVSTRSDNIKNRKPVTVAGVCRACSAPFELPNRPSGTERHTLYCSATCRPSKVKTRERAARAAWLHQQGLR